jgi:hypothetical protein
MSARILVLVLLLGCARPRPLTWHPENDGPALGCELKPQADCGIGTLARIDEKDWAPGELRSFFARVRKGAAAVDHVPGQTRVVPECRLAAAYGEVEGRPGKGRLWTVLDPQILLSTPLEPACGKATHVVAVFATNGPRFSAVLVPLACGSVSEPEPAAGCIGRGMTGPQRLARAMTMVNDIPRDDLETRRVDLGTLLDIYALAPDDIGVANLNLFRRQLRCPLAANAARAKERLERSRAGEPDASAGVSQEFVDRFDSRHLLVCRFTLPFLTCFPGLFEPAPGSFPGCWSPARPQGYP